MRSLSHLALAAAVAVAASSAAVTGARADSPDAAGFVRIAPADVHWVEIPGAHGVQFAALLGDQTKPGLYVIRVKFPPHWMDTPHWHPNDRYVTVLQGTWYTGTGPVFDPARAIPLGPGSVMKHPGKGVHWDGSAGDEPVIVQIIGIGPAGTTPLDPKVPEWVEVKTPASRPAKP